MNGLTRRRLLTATASGTAGLLATTPALAQRAPYGGYLSEARNYDGTTVDYRGQDEVTVSVGGGDAGLAFDPAAIVVDPGTTVVWEWTDRGGSHNVVAESGAFDSGDPVAGEGATFEYTFDRQRVYKYHCVPHREMGMRGVVAVGATAEGPVEPPGTGGGVSGGGGGGGDPGRPDFRGYLDDAKNYDGSVVDARGRDEVTVFVGAGDDGLAFSPPAVHVDNGATVRWAWTGDGGAHNVVAEDDTFASGSVVESGVFEYTFEADGIYRYYCAPHKAQGMKGAVVVGTGYPTRDDGETDEEPFDGYLSDANNYDGTVTDATDRTEVTVTVAPEAFAFDPAAVEIETGTTVVWEWSGVYGAHNVVAEDGTFDSGDPVSEEGHTFEYTFEEPGAYKYHCDPHEGQGMKGGVLVREASDADEDEDSGDGEGLVGEVGPGFGIGGALAGIGGGALWRRLTAGG